VHAGGRFLGVLFAGRAPDPTLPSGWWEDRRELLAALAERVAALVADADAGSHDRQARIVAFVERHLAGRPTLGALARHLGLSPSRTGHQVKDLFGITFPALVRRLRLAAAARLLEQEGMTVQAAAARVGCRDRDWFARHFRAAYGRPPSAWRRRPA
jgi:AraC-like DNA-binding protein